MASRGSRTTVKQYEILIQFMESHPKLVSGKFSDTFSQPDSVRLWDSVAMQLNSGGLGAIKDAAKWKKTWADWKCAVKGKASKLTLERKKTGGGTVDQPDLTSIEERLLAVIGHLAVEGNVVVPCPGFGMAKPAAVTKTSEEASRGTSIELINGDYIDIDETSDAWLQQSHERLEDSITGGCSPKATGPSTSATLTSLAGSSTIAASKETVPKKQSTWQDLVISPNANGHPSSGSSTNKKRKMESTALREAADKLMEVDKPKNEIKDAIRIAMERQAKAMEIQATALQSIAKSEEIKAIALKQQSIANTANAAILAEILKTVRIMAEAWKSNSLNK